MNRWYEIEHLKSKYFAAQIEYLGYWITRQGIQRIHNKVEMNATLLLRRPKEEKHNKIRQFIGIVNYYCDMWFRRIELQVGSR
jgi:hypothetical protein